MSLEMVSVGGTGAAWPGTVAETGTTTNLPAGSTGLVWAYFVGGTGSSGPTAIGLNNLYIEREM